MPPKRMITITNNEELLKALLTHFPGIFAQILTFLKPLHALRLMRVSRAFRHVCQLSLQGRYDPFFRDNTMSNTVRIYGKDQEVWNALGNYDLAGAFGLDGKQALTREQLGYLQTLGEEGFNEIWRTMKEVVESTGAQNKSCKLYAEVLNSSGRGSSDCVATLKIGECVCFSTNFRIDISTTKALTDIALNRITEHRGGPVSLVPAPRFNIHGSFIADPRQAVARHSEIRLITHWELATPEVTASELLIDKFCCLFCAIQLHALGLDKAMLVSPLQQFGSLNWYNFTPIVVLFPRVREQMWGRAFEAHFNALQPREKRQVLFYITQQALASKKPFETRRIEWPTRMCWVPECEGVATLLNGKFGYYWSCNTCRKNLTLEERHVEHTNKPAMLKSLLRGSSSVEGPSKVPVAPPPAPTSLSSVMPMPAINALRLPPTPSTPGVSPVLSGSGIPTGGAPPTPFRRPYPPSSSSSSSSVLGKRPLDVSKPCPWCSVPGRSNGYGKFACTNTACARKYPYS